MRAFLSRKSVTPPVAASVVPVGLSPDTTPPSSNDSSPTFLPYKPSNSLPPPNISNTISSLGLSTVSPYTLAASGIHVPPPITSPPPPNPLSPAASPSSSSSAAASPPLPPNMVEITPAFHPHSAAFALTAQSPERLTFVADAIAFSQSSLPLPSSSNAANANCAFSPSLASRPHSRSVDLTALPLDTMTKQLQAKQVMLDELEASHAEQLEVISRLKAGRLAWEAEEARRRKEIDELKALNDMLMTQCTEQAKQLSLLSKKTGGKSMFLMRDSAGSSAAPAPGSAPPSPQLDKAQPSSGHMAAISSISALPPSASSSSPSVVDLSSPNAAASSTTTHTITASSSQPVAGLSLAVPPSSSGQTSSPSSSPSATSSNPLSPASPSNLLSSTLNMTVTSLEAQLATAHDTIVKQKKELSLLRFLHPHTHQNEAKLSSISSLYAEEKEEAEKLRKKMDELNALNEDLEMALERQDGVIESLSVQQEESARKERGWRAECEEWKAREGKVREELKCVVEGKEAVEMQLTMVERERDEERKGRLASGSGEDREREREREGDARRTR